MWPLPPLKPCRFLKRRNRFLVEADVGPLHLPNSGRMGELLLPGTPCWYHPRPTPKTVGRMILVESQGVLVGVDASLANRLLEVLIREGFFGPLGPGPGNLRREVPLRGERLDFWARIGGKEAFLEAKNCNRVEEGLALFPDAPTPRGARHLRLLAAFARDGGLAYAVWMVQHPLAQAFALDPEDRLLHRAAREAKEAGVRLLAFRIRPTLEALYLDGELPWVFLPPKENLEGHHQGHG
ncbi:DNA/RNA nuclease SfsA [Thermus amyloliquefaciens]|uniref:DNA/RNA nuclease SfsA n=1 Tax=Thermus amyloliquefaciens TaxID=1449080 RepID=UPI00068CAC05|nr:DNA/RNA nuclease SfsA [Thermus amyloliquefaciens]